MESHLPSTTIPKAIKATRAQWGDIALCLLLASVAISFMLRATEAEARMAESQVSSPVPCALITGVEGQVDVLDPSRTHLIGSSKSDPIPCGGWVSVGKGSVELKHRDGFRIHAGAGSFVQLPEPNTDGKNGGDHVVLYRGQVFAQAGGGSLQLRVLTANSRARIQRGSAIVVYSHDEDETQLIALEHSSQLENRFETARLVVAKAGEATSLNFKQLRVVPSIPRAVAIAALRPKFADLRVPERDRQIAFRATRARQERIFASTLVEDDNPDREPASTAPGKPTVAQPDDPTQDVRERFKRKIARNQPAESYMSHADDEETRAIRKQWVNRMVAGIPGGHKLVAPERIKPKTRGTQAAESSGATGPRRKARQLTAEDEEKLRLIEELSRIREE